MSARVQLSSAELDVELDPARGCDILSVVHTATSTELLFSSPWRDRADAIRKGDRQPLSADSYQSWMEQYRGGWQTLCPNAGPQRDYRGVTLGFHGEASVVPWSVLESDGSSARLAVTLFTVPLRIERALSVRGSSLELVDMLTNTSDEPLTVDYSSHPALGGDLLGAECTVSTNAATFVPDPGLGGTSVEWPGHLDSLPGPGKNSGRFGWLEGFPSGGDDAAWVSVFNPTLGLGARLSWDSATLPYAWWWQEFTSSNDFPWFGRARVFALEPSSTQTSGPSRSSAITIPARGSLAVPLRLSIQTANETESDSE